MSELEQTRRLKRANNHLEEAVLLSERDSGAATEKAEAALEELNAVLETDD
jgi:hypothetical protein